MQTSYSIFTLGALEPKLYLEKSVYNYYWFLFSLGFNSHYAGWTGAVAMSSLAVVSFFFVILLCKRTKKFGALMLILAWIVLFPLVSRLANVLSTNNSFRISFAQFLLGPILVSFVFTALRRLQEENINARRLFLNKMGFWAILSCAVAVFVNVRYTNRAFVIQRVLYERMMFHTGQVMRDLVELERSQQIKDKKILVVGLFDVQGWPAPFKDYREIEGFRSSTGITSHLKFYAAARLLGYSFDWNVSDVEMIKMKKEEEVMGMPCYPDSGYIKEVNGFLVIKLGQETE